MIGRNAIVRLSRYKNALYRFKEMGFVKVFSDNLAEAVVVTAAQVRKDFSLFGISGNKRAGYQIDVLIEKLNEILGKHEIQKVVIVGAGNIGKALLTYRGFEKEGIRIVAAFDIDPSKFQKTGKVPVYALDHLRDFVRDEDIRIGILAVPDIAAQQVFDLMVQAGIGGVLNFAPIALRGGDDIVINNVNLELELENLSYFVNASLKAKSDPPAQSGR